MTARRVRLRLQPLEGRDTPGSLTVTFAAASHTLTVIGDGAANQLTVQADAGDRTHFTLSSPTDTFNGAAGPFSTPTGVRNIVIRMLSGDDIVTVNNAAPVRLRGSLRVDGGDGANTVQATDLTVGGSLAVVNGTNDTGRDTTVLTNLSVGGGVTVRNGDGDTEVRINRNAAGMSAVRGGLLIANGTGHDLALVSDTHVGGNVTVRNGHGGAAGAGRVSLGNEFNTTAQSVVRGSVAVSYLDGDGDGPTALADLEVFGNLRVSSGAGADDIRLNRLTVHGATRLSAGDGFDRVSIDDSRFARAVAVALGGENDEVRVETAAGTTAATVFGGAVRITSTGGGDTVVLAGPDDAGQQIVFAGPLAMNFGAGVGGIIHYDDHLAFPFARARTF